MSSKKTIYLEHLKKFKHLPKNMQKFVNGLSPPIMTALFSLRENHVNFRNFQFQYSDNKKFWKLFLVCGNLTFRLPQTWNNTPIKEINAARFSNLKKQ